MIFFIQIHLLISVSFTISLFFIGLSIVFGLLSFLKPIQSLYLLLLLMVVFGSRPSMEQTHYLILGTGFWILSVYAQLILKSDFEYKLFLVKLRSSNLVSFFSLFFILTSFLSLIGLPIIGALKHTIQEDVLYIFKELLTVGETTLYSSVQSVFFLLQGYLIGLYIYATTRTFNQFKIFKNALFSLFIGWLLFIIVGYIDFFGFIDLTQYYFWDETPHRFTSFFPNSSWSSQYLAVTLPLLPIVLLWRKINRSMLILMVFLIVLGEVALLLSMQRGAWLTYPPTLLMIWITIYYVFARSHDNTISLKSFLKTSWLKIFITIPLTVIISATVVYEIKDYRQTHSIKSATNTFDDVYSRMGKVSDTGNRKVHWPPAIKLFLENPIFGGGGDSFGWQYKEYFYKPNAKWHDDEANTLKIGQFGTAHNLYLQTLVGKGIFGLIFLLAFLIILIYKLIQKEFLSAKQRSLEESILTLIVLGSLTATLIYANVQEIFYTQPVAIIFWVVVFIGAGLTHDYAASRQKREELWNAGKYLFYFLLLLLPFHVLNISYIREFIAQKMSNFIPALDVDASTLLVGSSLWLGVFAIILSFWMHRKVIIHTHQGGFFIDDHEGDDKSHGIHTQATPRAGGIGIFAANLFLVFNPLGWKFILAALPAFIVGLFDDFKPLQPRTRLFLQALSGLLSVLLLDALVYSLGFDISLPYLAGLFITIIAITGAINAINMIDGFNGLSTGTVLMMLLSMSYVSIQVGDMNILEILAINAAAVIGFMFINFPRGHIFLGDGGAYFLGFLVSAVSLMLAFHHKEVSQLYPLALLIYPVFEVLFSIYRRKIFKNISMTQPDKIHLHQLIFRRITKNNPRTSVYLWKRLLPFMIISTYFYDNDLALSIIVLMFMISYVKLYRKIVRFR